MLLRYDIPDETTLDEFGKALGCVLQPGCIVYLSGALGAGKTALVRSVLSNWGIKETIKSPTYTLVESYWYGETPVYHFDLYRLGHPEELEYLGIRDYFNKKAICLVEWPEKGLGYLPASDLTVDITFQLPGRCIELHAQTARGEECLSDFCYKPTE